MPNLPRGPRPLASRTVLTPPDSNGRVPWGRLVVACHHGAAGELAALLWEHQQAIPGAAGAPDAAGGPESARDAAALVAPGVLLLGAVLLVAPGDTRGLAAALGVALDMPPEERRRRTRAAQAAVRARLSLTAFVDGTFAVYAEVGPLDLDP